MRKVLVIDDQPAVREAFRVLFDVHDIPCAVVDGPEAALERLRRGDVGAVIQDMNFSPGRTDGAEGVELFRRLRAVDPDLPVLLVTAWTSLETAVQLVKEGASDYLAKPWNDVKLVDTLRALLHDRGASGAAAQLDVPDGLIAESPALRRVAAMARRVGAAAVPILITGPNGAGKEKIAELVHRSSPRRERTFLKVNVGALPDELIEAELFGAAPGAYTGRQDLRLGRFEEADGGTLFLDEIDSLSLQGQVKLLRVLENGEITRLGENRTRRVDVRVLSATNADLERAIADGRFREDLYFRLHVVELRVPPLRERPEDVRALAEHFLGLFAAERGAARRRLSNAAWTALLAHPWPGNVRELRNRLQRADLLAVGAALEPADLELERCGALSSAVPANEAADEAEPSDLTPEELAERRRVERALVEAEGVVARAAETLGISRQALYRKMDKLGVALERRPTGAWE